MKSKTDKELISQVMNDDNQKKNFITGLIRHDFLIHSSEEPKSIKALAIKLSDTYYYFKIPAYQPVCWKCWVLSTGEGLSEYKRKYSSYYEHPGDNKYDTCPLCKYSRWVGSGWYPGKYFSKNTINPSKYNWEEKNEL